MAVRTVKVESENHHKNADSKDLKGGKDMEFLKDVLGDELYGQVSEKLAGNDKIRIANVADGSFVPKDKFDNERNNVKTLKGQIDELNGKLTAMQSANVDTEGLKSQLAQLQTDLAAKDAEMKAQALAYLVKEAIGKSKARNADIVAKMVDMSKVTVDGSNLIGLNDQLEALKKSDAYLFEDEPSHNGGFDPHHGNGGGNRGGNFDVNAAIRSAAGR